MSGYFFHRRGLEAWTKDDLGFQFRTRLALELEPHLNQGQLQLITSKISLCDLLCQLDQASGMRVEMLWRKYFCGLNPLALCQQERVLTLRFEDIMIRPKQAVEAICTQYEYQDHETDLCLARLQELEKKPAGSHVRDTSPNQFQRFFDTEIDDFFELQFPRLAQRMGYANGVWSEN